MSAFRIGQAASAAGKKAAGNNATLNSWQRWGKEAAAYVATTTGCVLLLAGIADPYQQKAPSTSTSSSSASTVNIHSTPSSSSSYTTPVTQRQFGVGGLPINTAQSSQQSEFNTATSYEEDDDDDE